MLDAFAMTAADTPVVLCSTGDVRLEPSTVNATASSLEGRLELCINHAWGTVCDSLFDNSDAQVACSRVSGFARQGELLAGSHEATMQALVTVVSVGAQVLTRGSIASGTGPIYLSDLHCTGNENSLLDCLREDSQPTGLQSCDHQQDVAIQCRGTCTWECRSQS
jgi:deleted-in-malignant-brain-tumors protein 1